MDDCVYIIKLVRGNEFSGAAIVGVENKCWKSQMAAELILENCGYKNRNGYWEYINFFKEMDPPTYEIVALKIV